LHSPLHTLHINFSRPQRPQPALSDCSFHELKPRYTGTAIALHWVLALALIGIFAFGLYMTGLPFSPTRLKYFNWHKWAGMTILILSVLRLVWRITHRPPELPEAVTRTMPGWQRMAHHGVHHLMYALFFAIPLVGWMYSSAAGFPIVLFGQLPCLTW
jgi:cytochrome b561